MSVKVMSHIWEHASCKGGELLVLLALGDHAKDDGADVYPSVGNLAKKARISRRSVQYILRKFEAAGVLVLVANEGGGRGKAREYRLDVDAIERAQICCTLSGDKGRNDCAVSEPKGRNLEQERAQSATQKGAIAVAPESSGTVIEPSEEESLVDEGVPSRTELAEQMGQVWAEELGDVLTVPVKFHGARVTALTKRLREDFGGDLANWRRYCQRIRGSPFLIGENDRGWRADFDWALKPANLAKILEGRYEPKRSDHREPADQTTADRASIMRALAPELGAG